MRLGKRTKIFLAEVSLIGLILYAPILAASEGLNNAILGFLVFILGVARLASLIPSEVKKSEIETESDPIEGI